MPRVSVLMGAYNCADTVEKSIRSIQEQTMSDWELIVCDDGSSDGTLDILKRAACGDPRIRIISNECNRGLSYTLNRCIADATGEYCARMDGDDVCDPERFEKQIAFLERHGEYGFVSTTMKKFDENGVYFVPDIGVPYSPTVDDFVKGSPFCHAPVMIRRNAYESVGGYRVASWVLGVEDYDLWFRLYAAGIRGCVLQEPLYSMFDGRGANARRTYRRRINEFKVRRSGYGEIGVPAIKKIYAIKPLIVGLIPKSLYRRLKSGR